MLASRIELAPWIDGYFVNPRIFALAARRTSCNECYSPVLTAWLANDVVHAQIALTPAADSYVRRDVNERANDNYGCDPNIIVGGSRGGGGIPFGGADAMRLLLRFDLATITQPVSLALLELTISDFHSTGAPQTFTLQAHRILDSWDEGDGNEQTADLPEGCERPNPASGVAWLGAGEGGDANNQSQPDFDPLVVAVNTVDMTQSTGTGEVRQWDVTTLINGWITGVWENHGLVIRDPTSDGFAFKQIGFASRETDTVVSNDPNWPSVSPGPRLVLVQPISVEPQSWSKTKGMFRDAQ